jgi:hypothetical protein
MDFMPDFGLGSAQRGWTDEEQRNVTEGDGRQERGFHGWEGHVSSGEEGRFRTTP